MIPRPHSQSRPRWLAVVLIPSMILGSGGVAHAQDLNLATRMRQRLQPFVDRGEIAGAVAMVGAADKVLGLVTLGQRDLEHDQPMEIDTLFRIASMTKPVTAAAVLMLADEGRVGLDQPVSTYLPEFQNPQLMAPTSTAPGATRPPARQPTLRDLLTHTSGIPDTAPPGHPDPPDEPDLGKTLASVVRKVARRPLVAEPGSRWAYSNAGIITLGRVVEVVSGRPFETFLDERIFNPLGMTDTTFYPTPEQMRRAAVTYDRKDGKLVAVAESRTAPVAGERYPNPAGGLYSTAPDLAKLDQLWLHRGSLGSLHYLSNGSFDAMTRPQTGDLKTGFTPGMCFGLGCGVVRRPEGVTAMLTPGTFGHGGAFGTQNWIDPHRGRFVILLIQRIGLGNNDDTPMRLELQHAAFDEAR